MIVSDITFSRTSEVCRLQAVIQTNPDSRREKVGFIQTSREFQPPHAAGDPFLAACLLPAMFLGEDLEIRAPVSPKLASAIDSIQDVFLAWYPNDLQRIRVVTPQLAMDSGQTPKAAGCFFSGGVDSWFSTLKHRAVLTDLITVKGFDIPCSDTAIWPQLVQANQQLAAELGLNLWLVETNLRDCIDPGKPGLRKHYPGDFWGRFLHGGFLAAVGLTLQSHLSTIFVPSSFSRAALHPWGSHPSVDPLWSIDQTRFIHDGCEATRVQKLQVLTGTDTSLAHLRVCPSFMRGKYNCGTCEKCLRTLLTLHLFNATDRAKAFPGKFSLDRLLTLEITAEKRVWYEEILADAISMRRDNVARTCRMLLNMEKNSHREWLLLLKNLGRRGQSMTSRWKRSYNKRKARWFPPRDQAVLPQSHQ